MTANIIIYEDNGKLRQSLKTLLQYEAQVKVVADFDNCDDAITHIETYNPQVIIMDIDMPGIGGIKGVRLIKNHLPHIKIIMHTVFDDDNRIFESICAGADGYLLKNTSPSKLLQSLINVIEGDMAMSPFVAQKVFQYFRNQRLPEKDIFNLTKRETEILQLLVNGNSYKMIADKSQITVDTVKKHLHNIYNKLHVNSGTEAVAKALQNKIVILD